MFSAASYSTCRPRRRTCLRTLEAVRDADGPALIGVDVTGLAFASCLSEYVREGNVMEQRHRPPVGGEERLPAVLDVPEAARMLGIGRTLAYELVRTDEWPTPVIRIGRLVKVPIQPLLDYLATGDRANG
jgi:hypothetical protein